MNDDQNPYQMPSGRIDGDANAAGDLSLLAPLVKSAGWAKFAGIMFIIGGAFSVLTIWGIIVAWIPIWMGILLIKFSNMIRTGTTLNDPKTCRDSLDKLRLFIKILGVLMIVYIGVFLVAIFAAILIPNILAARQK